MTHFSILDSKDMVNTHRSSSGNDARSFMLKRLKTSKNSKFSQNDRNVSDFSSAKSSVFAISNKDNSPITPIIKARKNKHLDKNEDVSSDIGNDNHNVADYIKGCNSSYKTNYQVKSSVD